GLGRVTAQISDQGRSGRPGGFVISNVRNDDDLAGELWGLGRWLNDARYGTWRDDALPLPDTVERSRRGIRQERAFRGEALSSLREAAIQQFVQRVQNWPEQQDLALLSNV